jgi:glycosyltransferase involved in cell wall biosynthesis
MADRSTLSGWHAARPLSIAMIGLRGIPASYGGVERAVEELSATLIKRGHRVTVFARNAYSDRSIKEHRGIEVRHLPQINTKHLEAITHTAVALAVALRSGEYDVVHIHATGPAMLSFVPRLWRVPTVATVQGLDWRREKWGPIASITLRLAARASAVFPSSTIVVSRELQRHYRQAFGTDCIYIPNGVDSALGVDPTPIAGLEPGRFILFLGRLVPEKHVHTLIQSYRHTETDIPLVVAGPSSHSPDYVSRLEALASEDPRVRLIGPCYGGEKAWLLRNALAFVQPSSVEGLPIALLEALEAGRYPIVSNIPENLEPVTVNGQPLGLQVPVDDEMALARAIDAAIASPDREAVTAVLSRHVRATYDWGAIAKTTEAVYRHVTARRQPAGKR